MHRRAGSRFQRVLPESDGSLLSRVAGLKLRPEGERIRLIDAETGEPLPWADEEAEAREAAAEEAKAARLRAQAAEERIQALEEELARLREKES